MFEAYSYTTRDVVGVENAYDIEEVFSCPNPHCSAKFIIRSADGKKKKHFARKPSTPHVKGCFYNIPVDSSFTNKNSIKTSVEEIFYAADQEKKQVPNIRRAVTSKNSTEYPIYIRTPKQLLKFCTSNKLDTVYMNNILVKDVILDSRNLAEHQQAEGIEGIRLLAGETSGKYYCTRKQTLYFHVFGHSNSNIPLTLHASVVIPERSFYDQIIKYLYTGDETRKPIVVFGDWVIDKKFNVSCTLNRKSNVLYKLNY